MLNKYIYVIGMQQHLKKFKKKALHMKWRKNHLPILSLTYPLTPCIEKIYITQDSHFKKITSLIQR